MTRKLIAKIPIFFSLILAVAVAFTFFLKPQMKHACGNTIVAGGNSKIGGQFSLTDVNNQEVNSTNIITTPTLIYFGYSYCPDVCPFDLQRNMIAIDMLDEKGTRITPMFITIDPARDTPKRLKEFSTFIHPRLIALTGSEDEVKRVMKLFKVYGQKSREQTMDSEDYLMDHSAFTYLVDASGKFVDYFNRKISAEEMVTRIDCLLTAKTHY